VMYGFAFATTNLLIGWCVVNIKFSAGELLTMPAARVGALLALIGAGSFFISGVGVLVSLRATTVRQAQQTFGVILLVLMMTPVLFVHFTSVDFQSRVLDGATRLGVEALSFRAAAALGALAVVLNLAAIGRFKRGKLVLE